MVDRAMNFFQPSSSGRFKPMPNKPSMISAGRVRSAASSFKQIGFRVGQRRALRRGARPKFPRGAGVVAVVAFAGENQNQIARRVSCSARRAIFLPTRRMTSASVWPAAQVALSHSRIWAMLMTGTGMAQRGRIFVGGGKSEN
jgi:hypothetical protein